MEFAAITFYEVAVFVHVLAVILAFGPTFAYPVLQTVTERSNPRALPALFEATRTYDRTVGSVAVLAVLGIGIYLVIDGPFGWDATFVNVGLAGVIVLIGLLHGFFLPTERKLAELAQRDVAAAGPSGEVKLSDEYQATSQRIAMVGMIATLIVLVTLFFMVVKP